MKKLVVLSQNYPPYIKGGAEISTSLMIKNIASHFDISVITSKYINKSWVYDGVNVYPALLNVDRKAFNLVDTFKHYNDMLSYHYKNYLIANKYLSKLNPDIIQCIFGAHYYLPSIIAAINTKKPVVIDIRDFVLSPISYEGRGLTRYLIFLYEKIFSTFYMNKIKSLSNNTRSNLIFITISEYMKTKLIESGYPKKRIYVVPNLLPDIPKIHSKKIINNSIVYAGRLTKEKGIWVAIKAYMLLNDRSIIFYIAGDGPENESIHRFIKEQKLNSIIMLGKISNKKVINLYKKNYLIIAPSIWAEPFGRFIQESYATLTPCIATRVGGIPEGITHRKTGILVEPNSHKALANAINMLLNNKKLYLDLVANLKKYRYKFSSKLIVNKRLSLYEKLLNKHN